MNPTAVHVHRDEIWLLGPGKMSEIGSKARIHTIAYSCILAMKLLEVDIETRPRGERCVLGLKREIDKESHLF